MGEAEAVADVVAEGSPSSVTVAGCPTRISLRGRWVGHMPLCCPVRDLLPPPSPRTSMMLLTHRRRSPSKRAGLAGHEESERRRRGSGYGEVAEVDHGRRRHAHAPPLFFLRGESRMEEAGGWRGMTLPPAARRRTGRTRRSYHIRARRLPRRGQRAQAAMGRAVIFRPAALLCMDHRRLKPAFNTLWKTSVFTSVFR